MKIRPRIFVMFLLFFTIGSFFSPLSTLAASRETALENNRELQQPVTVNAGDLPEEMTENTLGLPLADYTVTIQLGCFTETVDPALLASWREQKEHPEKGSLEQSINDYVSHLAEEYNHSYDPLVFINHEGEQISISTIDLTDHLHTSSLKQKLTEAVEQQQSIVLEAGWSDFTDFYIKKKSYIEIDLSHQHLWLYQSGEIILDTDCVTGTADTECETPTGLYAIYYMNSPATLRGADYATAVSYWMAFCGNVGLHDAAWRDSFGGTIYTSDGSHGCVNLPIDAAKTIYENVEYGYPVICY